MSRPDDLFDWTVIGILPKNRRPGLEVLLAASREAYLEAGTRWSKSKKTVDRTGR